MKVPAFSFNFAFIDSIGSRNSLYCPSGAKHILGAMSITDSTYDNLREKLDILGYQQTLPLSAVPLVGVIFEDLIKTTESLRNAKLEIAKYLEVIS